MPGCTRFASHPYFDEAMIPENTVILPEQTGILRRESRRSCVAMIQSQLAGAPPVSVQVPTDRRGVPDPLSVGNPIFPGRPPLDKSPRTTQRIGKSRTRGISDPDEFSLVPISEVANKRNERYFEK